MTPHWRRLVNLGRFVAYLLRRFTADRCLTDAASLSYTTLLAIVPLVAIALAVLSAFPIFDSIRDQVQSAILHYMAPHISEDAQAYFNAYIAKARDLTTPGLAGLAVSAVILLATVEDSFNVIWRVASPRRLPRRILAYIAALVLAPVLIGGALSFSTYVFARASLIGIGGLIGPLDAVLPPVLTIAGFTVVYYATPNCAVRLAHAFAGAVIAGILFELLKSGFGLYLRMFPAYETIYGALSAIPVFLLWVYLAWSVALFGAEIVAGWPSWRAGRATAD